MPSCCSPALLGFYGSFLVCLLSCPLGQELDAPGLPPPVMAAANGGTPGAADAAFLETQKANLRKRLGKLLRLWCAVPSSPKNTVTENVRANTTHTVRMPILRGIPCANALQMPAGMDEAAKFMDIRSTVQTYDRSACILFIS